VISCKKNPAHGADIREIRVIRGKKGLGLGIGPKQPELTADYADAADKKRNAES
jgi:hypothetical protein